MWKCLQMERIQLKNMRNVWNLIKIFGPSFKQAKYLAEQTKC
jgi:hypothetical protein